jgi:uncharacterized cupin superfamily protein
MAKRINVAALPVNVGSGYPVPFGVPCAARARQRLGDAAGLTDFGVNLLRLPPGTWSSQRHWHSAEDEFIYVLEGELTLVTDAGEEILRPGDCAGIQGRRSRWTSLAESLLSGCRSSGSRIAQGRRGRGGLSGY